MARKHKQQLNLVAGGEWMCFAAEGTEYEQYFNALFGNAPLTLELGLSREYDCGTTKGTALRVYLYPIICNWQDQGVAIRDAHVKLRETTDRYLGRQYGTQA